MMAMSLAKKRDMARDKKMGIKEDSKRDRNKDKKVKGYSPKH